MGQTAIEQELDEHTELVALRKRVSELEQLLAWYHNQKFWKKSEQMSPGQMSLFSEELAKAQAALKQTTTTEHVKAHDRQKRKKSNEKLDPNVETIEEVIDIPPEQRACEPGWNLVSVGTRFVWTSVQYVSAKVVKINYSMKVYKKLPLKGDADPRFVQPHVPNAVIIRSMTTASILAKVIHDKYELDVPLYRQLSDWKRIGLMVSETTLCLGASKCRPSRAAV